MKSPAVTLALVLILLSSLLVHPYAWGAPTPLRHRLAMIGVYGAGLGVVLLAVAILET